MATYSGITVLFGPAPDTVSVATFDYRVNGDAEPEYAPLDPVIRTFSLDLSFQVGDTLYFGLSYMDHQGIKGPRREVTVIAGNTNPPPLPGPFLVQLKTTEPPIVPPDDPTTPIASG